MTRRRRLNLVLAGLIYGRRRLDLVLAGLIYGIVAVVAALSLWVVTQ